MVSNEHSPQLDKPELPALYLDVSIIKVAEQLTRDIAQQVFNIFNREKKEKLRNFWHEDDELVIKLANQLLRLSENITSDGLKSELGKIQIENPIAERVPVGIKNVEPVDHFINQFIRGQATYQMESMRVPYMLTSLDYQIDFKSQLGNMTLPEGFLESVHINVATMLPQLIFNPPSDNFSLSYFIQRTGSELQYRFLDCMLVSTKLSATQIAEHLIRRLIYPVYKREPDDISTAIEEDKEFTLFVEWPAEDSQGNEITRHREQKYIPIGIIQLPNKKQMRAFLVSQEIDTIYSRRG